MQMLMEAKGSCIFKTTCVHSQRGTEVRVHVHNCCCPHRCLHQACWVLNAFSFSKTYGYSPVLHTCAFRQSLACVSLLFLHTCAVPSLADTAEPKLPEQGVGLSQAVIRTLAGVEGSVECAAGLVLWCCQFAEQAQRINTVLTQSVGTRATRTVYRVSRGVVNGGEGGFNSEMHMCTLLLQLPPPACEACS
jgi:hypothetical protein